MDRSDLAKIKEEASKNDSEDIFNLFFKPS